MLHHSLTHSLTHSLPQSPFHRDQRTRFLAAPELSETFHSWVGIIMYLPTEDPAVRKKITEAFLAYKAQCAKELWGKFDAHEHWAKIEVPGKEVMEDSASSATHSSNEEKKTRTYEEGIDQRRLKAVQERLRRRYPLEAFAQARRELDPHQVLSNKHVKALMPLPESDRETDNAPWGDGRDPAWAKHLKKETLEGVSGGAVSQV